MVRFLRSWGLPILVVVMVQQMASRGLLTDGSRQIFRGLSLRVLRIRGLRQKKNRSWFIVGSWCGICKAMQGSIARVAKDHRVISVALRSGSVTDIRGYMDAQGFKVPTLADETGMLGEAYGVRGVPALFFIGRNGRIRTATTGFTTEPGIRLRLWWLDRF